MWMLYLRTPAPDAAHWPGRRGLAVLDAALWPTLIAAFAANLSIDSGLVGRFVIAACVLAAMRRCSRALMHNERYRFATGHWATLLAAMVMMGVMLKLPA